VAPPPSPARLRLVCLPHAGGGAAAFQAWPALVDDDVEVWAARLPGRESRYCEPPLTDMAALVAGLAPALAAIADRPYAVFGHSLGAVAGLALCLHLQDAALPLPVLLLASGHEAPHVAGNRDYHLLGDDELTAVLSAMSGTPGEVLSEPGLMELFLPAIRADLALLETYRPPPGAQLRCPVVTYRGADDDLEPGAVARWAELAAGPVPTRTFPGGHFYLDKYRAEVVGAVMADVARAMAGDPLVPTVSVGPAQ
jgi:surfactin synthase thioesterase subunit